MDSAMDVMYMLHFDYQDLSAAEFSIKRFMPFYTWMRNNVPLQLRMAFLQTGKMSNLFAATEEAKEAFGVDGDMAWLNDYLPDYMEINNGFVSYLKFGGNHLALFPKLPINDVDQLFGVGYIGSIPVPVPRITTGFGNALGPAVRTPMEFFTQRNFQYGYEYDSFSEFTSKQLESTIPYIGTFARAGSAVGLPVEKTPFIDLSAQKGKQVSNLMQLLFGAPFGATMYNERTLKGVTYGRSKQLSKELNQAASDAGVDIDWLRDQLEKGVSPEALARKIESGQGDIDRVARRKKLDELTGKTKKKKPKDYRDVMKELQRGD
jgi:hypothetical protein